MTNRRSGGATADGLDGTQTSGRSYRNLSEPTSECAPVRHVRVMMSDGVPLSADVHAPSSVGQRWPALLSFSCYPRQVQDLRAPLGFVEAGMTDYFVSRGYVHVLVNARGTGGSGGTFALGDERERQDVYDVVEWIAEQPWSDGQVGGMGISYFALAQLGGATLRPPHLKAIFPFATLGDLYGAVWHNGVRSSGFVDAWLSAVSAMAARDDAFWYGRRMTLARRVLDLPVVQRLLPTGGGAHATAVLRRVFRNGPSGPFARLWQELAVEHPTHDDWWDRRSLLADLEAVDIPVYLGCQWDNVPMHLPGTFEVWEGLAHNPNVRMTLADQGVLSWPWQSLHTEALAWYDHWLKGRDTGIMEGPPIRYVVPGDDRWRTATSWPPPSVRHVAYALGPDGVLDLEEPAPGSRSYVFPGTAPTRTTDEAEPDRLVWRSAPVVEQVDLVGDIELELDATITALDASWVVLLSDEAPDQTTTTISAGWLRAQLRAVDEDTSRPGRPVLTCREPQSVEPGAVVRYRIPLVPNARRLEPEHRLKLLVASADANSDGTAVLGFTHTPVDQPSRNAVFSSSRLLLPVPCDSLISGDELDA